jgi:hypothetical protein
VLHYQDLYVQLPLHHSPVVPLPVPGRNLEVTVIRCSIQGVIYKAGMNFYQKCKSRLRHLTAAYKRTVKRWPIASRPIDVSRVIERLFRYIEMVFLTALVSVVVSVVSEATAYWLSLLMFVAAGLPLGIAITEWLDPSLRITSRKRQNWYSYAMMSLIFAVGAASFSMPLEILLKATFQIDVKRARGDYFELRRREAVMTCTHAHLSNEICERRYKNFKLDGF